MSMENLGPYTNFHELNQDWFLNEFNKVVEQWKAMQKNFDNLQDAFNNLKSYMQDYFKNLDVQEKINNKLNAMINDGTLLNIILPTINNTTSNWLTTHITNPSNPPIDTSLSITGAAADSKVTGDNFKTLDDYIKNIAFIGFQYINLETGKRYKYYEGYENIHDTNDSNYIAFPTISVPAGKYYVQNLSDVFTFFDDGTSLKNYNGYDTTNKTLNLQTSKKISITGYSDIGNTIYTLSNIRVNDNKYGTVYVEITGDNIPKHTKITVGNGKDFTKIKEAVESITDSSQNNVYDIYIDDGIYSEYAITLPNYVNLIGASGNKEKCVIKGELSDSASENEITTNSTINLMDSNTLENLTITAKNLRYPIHSESGGNHINWIQILNNCFIEHFGNTSPNNKWTTYHAWGEGASSGSYAEFNNCIFKSPIEPWYVHEFAYLPDIPKPYHHILNNCQIINTTVSNIASWLSTVKIDNTKNSDIINTIDFNNCNFYNGEISINNTCPINVNIHGCNNAAIRVTNEYPNTDYTNIKTYVGVNPVKKGTVLKYDNGINIVKIADANTPPEMIAGIVVEDCESNSLVKIIKKTYITSSSSYPIGSLIYCDNNGQITNDGQHAIGISYGEFYLIN